MSMINPLPLFQIVLLMIGAVVLGIFGDRFPKISKAIAFIICIVPLACSIILIEKVSRNNVLIQWLGCKTQGNVLPIGIGFEVDAFGLLMALVASVLFVLILVYYLRVREKNEGLNRLLALFLIIYSSCLGVFFTNDLFDLYIFFEIMSISAAIFVALGNDRFKSFEISFKFITISTFGSLLILFGICMLYSEVHTFNLAQICVLLYNKYTSISIFAFATIFAGCTIKVFLFPFIIGFHSVQDSGMFLLSSTFSGIFSMTGIYAIMRVLYTAYQNIDVSKLSLFIVILGTAMVVFGLITTFWQTDLIKIIGSHSIVQIGYIIITFGLGLFYDKQVGAIGIMGALYHIVNYLIFITLMFMCVGSIFYSTGTTDIRKLKGLSKTMPVTTVSFFVAAMSISGLPPFNGFVSKWLIYKAAYKSWGIILTGALVLISIITLISLMRIIYRVFFRTPSEDNSYRKVPLLVQLPMIVLSILCLVTGIIPTIFSKYFLQPAASAVYNIESYVDSMFTKGYASRIFNQSVIMRRIDYSFAGYLKPEAWVLIFLIIFVAIVIFFWAYFNLPVDDVFNSLELEERSIEYSKANLFKRAYIKTNLYIQNGTVNDYAFWIIFLYSISILCIFTTFKY